jgi:hypothetical protein
MRVGGRKWRVHVVIGQSSGGAQKPHSTADGRNLCVINLRPFVMEKRD